MFNATVQWRVPVHGIASSRTRNIAQPKANQHHRRVLVREMPAVRFGFRSWKLIESIWFVI